MKGWLKERKAAEAMLLSLLPILLYGILGPLEIYAGNTDEFVFILKDFFFIFLLLSIVLWLNVSFVFIIILTRISNVLRVVLFTFSLFSYLQNIFFNI